MTEADADLRPAHLGGGLMVSQVYNSHWHLFLRRLTSWNSGEAGFGAIFAKTLSSVLLPTFLPKRSTWPFLPPGAEPDCREARSVSPALPGSVRPIVWKSVDSKARFICDTAAKRSAVAFPHDYALLTRSYASIAAGARKCPLRAGRSLAAHGSRPSGLTSVPKQKYVLRREPDGGRGSQ